jgi:ribosomal protein S18 acetylase RimI-like enzyme
VREVRADGHEALLLTSSLLQRARRADPTAGLWEAADVQWWWRRPRESDAVPQPFWLDDDGPVAAVLLTSWPRGRWQCDPLLVPGTTDVGMDELWSRAWEHCTTHASGPLEVLVRDDDPVLRDLVETSGLTPGEHGAQTWMDAADRPVVRPLPEGFTLVDRVGRAGTPHPMRERNGDQVGDRLAETPLYDPALDLAVETADGELAAYSLYWHDPTTGVGLVEPVRVEDAFQRRGLARAMITAGLERLAERGATRLKIGFSSGEAKALYTGLGFRVGATDTTFETVLPG